MYLIKVLLFALTIISSLLAKENMSFNEITKAQVKNENINNSDREKIVLFGANGELGRQIANQLLTKKGCEIHFTFSSKKSLSEFKEYAKKHLPHQNNNVIKEHIINILDENVELEPILNNSIVIISIAAKPSYKELPAIFWTKVWLKKVLGKDVNKTLFNAPIEYKEEQIPEKIDWLGQKKIIHNAKSAKHIILISSMLGSYENNFLNKWAGEKNILLWKRKSEIYLKNLGTPYTIIHPPQLIDKKNTLKVKDLFLGVNDLRDKFPAEKDPLVPPDYVVFHLKMPRSDLAYFIKECIGNLDLVKNKSFDIIRRKDIGLPALKINNLQALIAELGDKQYDYSYPKHRILGN